MTLAVFRRPNQYRLPLSLAGLFLTGVLFACFLHMRLGFSDLFFIQNTYSLPQSGKEFLYFVASLGQKPLFLALLLLLTAGGPFFSILSALSLTFRGFALGWCLAMLPHTAGGIPIPLIMSFVYLLESFLYGFLIVNIHQRKKHLLLLFLPVTGLILLLHTAVPLILFAP